jgi:hypothetical protein
MTLRRATDLAISAHAASVAAAAVASLPDRVPARVIQRAERAEREAVRRWLSVRKIIVRKMP